MGKKLNSLRFRLTVTFIGLILLFIMAMWATNDRFLEIYYQNYKVSLLQDAYTRIDEAVRKADEKSKTQAAGEAGAGKTDEAENPAGTSGKTEISAAGAAGIIDDEELAETVQQLRDTSNITVLIYDSMRGETLVSSTTDARMLQERVQRYILGQFPPQIETILETDNYRIQKSSDRRNRQAFLESWGYFTDNGTVFIMSVPMDSIREAAWISNRFLMYVGLIVAAIGAFLVYLITKYVTKPVNELSALSERMSRLDFDAKYTSTGHAATEIETLGNSMNTLSDRLKEAIGELRLANDQLQKDIDEKVKIDEMRKEFIADVSHELKTPIALIQGYAEGLSEGMAEDPENRDYYCSVIVDESQKMNTMVRQLLSLSALEFGQEPGEMTAFSLPELIRGVIAKSGIVLREKELSVEFDCAEDIQVYADEFRIEEVVTNYLNNAINHAAGDRRIAIAIGDSDEKNVVRVTVYNSGKHIPEEDLDKLWQKFYKVDKARTRAYGGSGIGLSIVKAVMDSHHRKYGAENCEGGVKFWFDVKRTGA